MIRRTLVSTVQVLIVGGLALHGLSAQQIPDVQVVPDLDVERYMGLWFAIASIPTSFERQCVQGTTAEYALLENGRIQVTNTCYDEEGEVDVARGNAWLPDPAEPSKLKVSFVRFLGLWWFGAPYWVIDLADDYSYAVVGHPTREFGWILSRTPVLSSETLEGIFSRLEQQGYERSQFRTIDQSIHASDPCP